MILTSASASVFDIASSTRRVRARDGPYGGPFFPYRCPTVPTEVSASITVALFPPRPEVSPTFCFLRDPPTAPQTSTPSPLRSVRRKAWPKSMSTKIYHFVGLSSVSFSGNGLRVSSKFSQAVYRCLKGRKVAIRSKSSTKNQNDWDVHLSHVGVAYNNPVSAATGLAPNGNLINYLPRPPDHVREP